MTWLNSNQVTRVTSYSVRNSLDPTSSSAPPSPIMTRKSSLSAITRSRLQNLTARRGPALSSILTNAALATTNEKSFAAFKVLPIDPARIREASSSGTSPYAAASEELSGAATCREAANMIVDSIRRACEDAGGGHDGFVTDEDVVR